MTTVSTHHARQNFAKLVELAFYKGEKIKIERNKRAMAWIVGEPFMNTMDKFIDYIIEHEPALADTLAIMLDDSIRQVIEKGTKEIEAGKTISLESILDD